MKLGDLEVFVLGDGELWLDGGAMFGVVPRTLWEKKMPPDNLNRVLLAMNCLLIRSAGKWILVETGAGNKWEARHAAIYGIGAGRRIPEYLAAAAVRPEDISLVINTHLHFDHCGWNTHLVGGRAVPYFPNARYAVQRGEYAHACHPTDRDRASYRAENFEPIAESGQWWLLDGDADLAPGVTVVRAPGHTADMQCVRLQSRGETAIFFADLIPTTAHLAAPWIMSYDLYPLTTLEYKKRWISRVVQESWLAFFAHDPAIPVARLKENEGRILAMPVSTAE